jgi:hypothetical protein
VKPLPQIQLKAAVHKNAIIKLIATLINPTPLNNATIQERTAKTKYNFAGVQSSSKRLFIIYNK